MTDPAWFQTPLKSHVIAASALAALVISSAGCGSLGPTPSGEGVSPSTPGTERGEAFLPTAPSAGDIVERLKRLEHEMAQTLPQKTRDALERAAGKIAQGKGLLLPLNLASTAWTRLGVAMHMRGAVSAAIWCDLRALESKPEHPALLSQLGFELNSQGRYEAALPFLLRAITADPKLGEAQANLAYTFWKLGRHDRAAYYYTQAIAIQPMAADWLLQLGEVYAEDDDPSAARAVLEEALSITPGDAETSARLAAISGATPPPLPPANEGILDVTNILVDCEKARMTHDYLPTVQALEAAAFAVENDHVAAMNALSIHETACETACSQDNDPWTCSVQCMQGQCTGAKAAVAKSVPAHLNAIIQRNAADLAALAHYKVCVRGRIDALKTATPGAIRFAEKSIRIQTTLTHESNTKLLANHLDIAQSWNQDAQDICSASQSAYDAFPGLADGLSHISFEMCLVVVCVNFTNGEYGLSLEAGLLAGELVYDSVNHSFSVGVGVGGEIPGIASAGVMLKFDSKKGIGVNGTAKLGGFLAAKYSKDVWLMSNREPAL